MMPRYRIAFLVETSLFNPLEGYYQIEEYLLKPCLITEQNERCDRANFVLDFLSEEDPVREGWDRLEATHTATKKAITFLSFLVLATRRWAQLTCGYTENSIRYGPVVFYRSRKSGKNELNCFNIDENARAGGLFRIQRPDISRELIDCQGTSLPSDILELAKRFLSLKDPERDKFINACLSYQFALENWMAYPTVSMVALVSAVESMMYDVKVDNVCELTGKECPKTHGVMKKFRMFFEQNIGLYSSVKLLNYLYSERRSKYVHESLLGKGEIRGIRVLSSGKKEEKKLNEEKEVLERLVNAGLIEWLKKR
jgi:hypothetical protein